MTDRDPFEDERDHLVEVGKKKCGVPPDESVLAPDADEGDDIDRTLAFQDLNDFGNANRLITRSGGALKFVRGAGWLVWDGSRWDHEIGETGANKIAHQIALAIKGEVRALKDRPGKFEERIGPLARHAAQSGNQARIASMLSQAAHYLTISVDDLDKDPFLCTCQNGTIELSTHCKRRAARREDLITKSLGTRFRAGATCPRWERFLEQIMPDAGMRAFLQRIFGYTLTGSTREQCIFILWGSGNNGKSTMMNVIRQVMGDYAMNSPVSTFLAKRQGNSGGDASPDLARLPGARMVTANEPPEGARLDEGRIKELAGGEPITARNLHEGFFEFRPTFKLFIQTNHRPTIRGTDPGIWRRIRLIPFTVSIPSDQVDRDLEQKLLAEAEGILQWMLTGAEEWFANGLQVPEKAIAAVETYRADEDQVGEFVKSRCDRYPLDYIDPNTRRPWETDRKRLREVYLEWCRGEGLDPVGAKAFGVRLEGLGLERRRSNSQTYYLGVLIKGDPLPGRNGG